MKRYPPQPVHQSAATRRSLPPTATAPPPAKKFPPLQPVTAIQTNTIPFPLADSPPPAYPAPKKQRKKSLPPAATQPRKPSPSSTPAPSVRLHRDADSAIATVCAPNLHDGCHHPDPATDHLPPHGRTRTPNSAGSFRRWKLIKILVPVEPGVLGQRAP